MEPTEPRPNASSPLARHWRLDPSVDFLNHGSFGACPTAVLDHQRELRDRMERNPVHFMVREFPALLDRAREELADFVGADAEEIAFVGNATTGINAILRSLEISPGDELLTSDHEYNACRNVLDEVARRLGAKVVIAVLPFPIAGEARAFDEILDRVTEKTRVVLIDHVTSPTGLVLPVENLVTCLPERVDLVIDGAHAPGMVGLDISSLGGAYYAGNCHKWMCSPKGAGFIRVPLARQPGIRPSVISHGANAPVSMRSRFRLEFDWTGTGDPTPFLSVPAAIRFLQELLPGGWSAIRQQNHALVIAGRALVAEALETPVPAPASMIGSMASVPLPDARSTVPVSPFATDPLQDRLFEEFQIEVPIVPWPSPPRRLVRLSAQLYNDIEQFRRLAGALRILFGTR